MKKGKTLYLWMIIILFILIWIPYFQYVASGTPVSIPFFFGVKDFTGMYPIMLLLGIVEGFLITVYMKTIVDDIKKDEPTKFDM